ncbi:hypothetical protein V5799_006909 [Amblyomma americanum]|uniref:Uncharacterized protein n=1 Tax=Amblyomma americanum TaxID=6943 RepID=A0AAQ4DV31_AMBAM
MTKTATSPVSSSPSTSDAVSRRLLELLSRVRPRRPQGDAATRRGSAGGRLSGGCRWHLFAIMATGAGCMVVVAILMYQEAQKAHWLAGSLAIQN